MSECRHAAPVVLLLIALVAFLPGRTSAAEDACTACHLALDRDEDPGDRLFTHMADDVHRKVGLGCADCHGGDPDAVGDEDGAMWEAPGFRGAPERGEIPAFCGRCHSDPDYMRRYRPQMQTDQEAQYWTSRHGVLLREGRRKVATCIDCHGVHGIRPVDDPRALVYPLNIPRTCGRCHADPAYMAEFGIPTDQLEKFSRSVHGVALLEKRDIGAPSCNDCHGNHGATPPSVENIAHVCGQCHVNNERLFQESHLGSIFVARGLGYCIGCHGKHDIARPDDRMLDWDEGAICLECHRPDEVEPRVLAGRIAAALDSLRIHVERAESLVQLVERKGLEASELLFSVEEARKNLVETRTSIHSFDPQHVQDVAADGHKAAAVAVEGALGLLDQWSYRRKGLLVASLLTTLLILLLYLKLRQIERR